MILEKEPIKQELSEILAKYYDGSFTRLVQEYIRISDMSEEEREALVEIMKQTIKNRNHWFSKQIIVSLQYIIHISLNSYG